MNSKITFFTVGGSVRDELLGHSSHDIDHVVFGATPEKLLGIGYIQCGKAFPVFIHPDTHEEYALARKEIKTGIKHTDFEFVFTPDITMEEDAMRRDLTINALYKDESGNVIDPTNKGLSDLQNKILRHVSEHFVEDPLRVLRTCRFAAQLNFTIAPETLHLMTKMVSEGQLNNLSQDRIDNEFIRALSPNYNSRLFFESMLETGALESLYPEIYALVDNKENTKYHLSGTTFKHVMNALDVAKDYNNNEKFAVLMHDIYKPVAYGKTEEELNKIGLSRANNNLKSEEFRSKFYFPHDGDSAVEYFDNFIKKHRFSVLFRTSGRCAIKYHMKMWSLFDGIKAGKWLDLISDITRDFSIDNKYKLDIVLKTCNADENSDKVNRGVIDRSEILKSIANKTFEECNKMRVVDIKNYQEMEYPKQLVILREIRLIKVKEIFKNYKNKGEIR